MDKQGIIHEHSKIKLELYRLYLERYLSVLLVTPMFDSVVVSDIFAGSGISENEEKGSPIIAAEAIENVKKEHNKHNKNILLNLNESDQNKVDLLTEHLKKWNFVTINNQDADRYIQSWCPIHGAHNFFFIDPHGYTQVTTENLTRLFTTQNCDFLIFVPIYHIYRFLTPSDRNEPIIKFLEGLGINITEAQKSKNLELFSDLIEGALKNISQTQFVYSQIIENKKCNSKYCLYFISHHILGAEKFLDAQYDLKTKTREPYQATFDFIIDPNKKSILKYVEYNQPYNNVELYARGIVCGLRPTEVKSEMKELEKNGQLVVMSLPGRERKRGGFYNDYTHYKSGDRIVTITFRR